MTLVSSKPRRGFLTTLVGSEQCAPPQMRVTSTSIHAARCPTTDMLYRQAWLVLKAPELTLTWLLDTQLGLSVFEGLQ